MGRLPDPPKPYHDDLYRQELLTIVQKGIDHHPRSAQALIGPSGVGGCERKIVWQLAYGANTDQPGGWAAHKGTCLHQWCDWWWRRMDLKMPDGSPRFLSDIKVQQIVPEVAGGTIDLFDKLQCAVIDFKFPGDSTMAKVKSGYNSPGYYAQANTYGLGLQRMGYEVRKVGLFYMPMGGDNLHDKAMLKLWDFDPSVAWDRLHNIQRLKNMLAVAPVRKVLEVAETTNDFCQGCPVFIGNGDKRAMCPGATTTSRVVNSDANPFAR